METDTMNDEIYKRWRRHIVTVCYLAWIFATVLEAVGGYMMSISGFDIHWPRYLILYVLMPAGFDLAAITAIMVVISNKKISNAVKNYVMMTLLCMIGCMLTTTHNYFISVSAVMLIPILCSGLFLDRKLIVYTTVVSILMTWVTLPASALLEGAGIAGVRVANTCLLTVIQIVGGVISGIIKGIYDERELKISRLKNAKMQLEQEVRVDGLTGLLNHTAFYEELDRAMMEYRVSHQPFAVVMMDIDNFKQTNDTYGHQTGDDLLRGAAQTLLDELEGKATAFRYGGDEFALICDSGDPYAVYDMLENCRKQIIETGKKISTYAVVDASFGIHMVKNAELSSREIVEKADTALRKAKSLGKGRIHMGS